MNEFIPSEYDKEWLRKTLELIKHGGVWVTTWASYIKIDEKILAVGYRNKSINSANVEENINRVKIVCEAIGVKFVDNKKAEQ